MTEELIKKWAREKANALEEKQTLGIYDRDEDMRYDEGYNDGQVSGYEEGLIDGYHEGFKDCAKSRLNVTTISDCPIKDDWHYVKDGEYPKDEKGVEVLYQDCDKINVYNCVYDIHAENWLYYNLDDMMLELFSYNVIAWKEIVFPKEIE